MSGRLSARALYMALALMFPLVWFLSRELADLLFRAMVVLFLIDLVRRKGWIHGDGLHMLCGAFCLVVLMGYLWHIYTIPETLFGGSRARQYLPAVCFFLLLAHGANIPGRLGPFLLLASAMLGLGVYLVFNTSAQDWAQGWQGQRVSFGIDNAQHAGVLFGAGLIATLSLTPRVIHAVSHACRPWVGCVMLAIACLMVWGVMVTQVRAVWLGLGPAILALIALPVLIGTKSSLNADPSRRRWVLKISVLAGTILLVSMVLLDAPTRGVERLAHEDVSLEALVSAARFEADGELSSAQVRVASWVAATDWIAQRPWLGWGGQTVKQLIRESPDFDEHFKQHFGHLHNSYLEALVALGASGFVLIAAIASLVGYRCVVAWRRGWMPSDVFVFAWAFILFWGTVNAFESYIVYPSGFFLNSVVGGFIYAFYLRGIEVGNEP